VLPVKVAFEYDGDDSDDKMVAAPLATAAAASVSVWVAVLRFQFFKKLYESVGQ
jgi:hypothetical protein